VPVLPAQNDVGVTFDQAVQRVSVSVYHFSVAAVRDQQEVIGWCSLRVFDINDFVVVAHDHVFWFKVLGIDKGEVLLN
jgi:hypothetical protein